VPPKPQAQAIAHPSPLRRAVSDASAPVLRVLSRQPKWLVGVVPLALLVAGLIVPGIGGAVLLLVVAALAGWLAYLSWPVAASTGQRAMRVLVVLALVGYAAYKIAVS
jgi:uncharacterized membrane protein